MQCAIAPKTQHQIYKKICITHTPPSNPSTYNWSSDVRGILYSIIMTGWWEAIIVCSVQVHTALGEVSNHRPRQKLWVQLIIYNWWTYPSLSYSFPYPAEINATGLSCWMQVHMCEVSNITQNPFSSRNSCFGGSLRCYRKITDIQAGFWPSVSLLRHVQCYREQRMLQLKDQIVQIKSAEKKFDWLCWWLYIL